MLLSAGQEVNTKYGTGVVVSVSSGRPDVYVRIHSSSQIYVLEGTEVVAIEPRRHDLDGLRDVIDSSGNLESLLDHAANKETKAAASIPTDFNRLWRGQMKRGHTRGRRPVEETPLSVFVRERLAELGMKQSEFCRLTGFDQGLLSKIQSSMISKLNLETALRLAVGLSASPRKIFALIGRRDLHSLIMKAYPADISEAEGVNPQEIPAPVREISQLALRGHALGRNLTPVVDLLAELVSVPADQVRSFSAGERRGDS